MIRFKRIRALILGCACFSINLLAQTESATAPQLFWIGDVHGDINKAPILAKRPTDPKATNYCVLLDAKTFDPFEQYAIAEEHNPDSIFGKLFLLVTLPSKSSGSIYTIELLLDKGIPVCTECDGGCAQLKKRTTVTITKQLMAAHGESTRHLIDVTRLVKDWHLIDMKLTAKVYSSADTLATSSTTVKEWPWCM